MLSYRHSYHAGNFADVLKHIVLIQILQHLIKKDKPLCYVDSHAGPGGYSLIEPMAQKTKEFESGVGRLWQPSQQKYEQPQIVSDYLSLVKDFNLSDELTHYPGSPWFARHLLRKSDRINLFELHTTEVEILREHFSTNRKTKILNSDGLQGSVALVPPNERRGLFMFDPSYEIKSDYQAVIDTVIACYKRFATGTYAIWYPVVDRYRINDLEKQLKQSGMKNIDLFELAINKDSDQFGMTSSGMIVINPPWILKQKMQEVLPYLANILGENGQGFYRIEALVGE